MKQLLNDGRILTDIVSAVIRQEPLRIAFSRLDWERVYRMADYHKVANIVYLGILGHRESLPEKWQERFFERYQESLAYGGNYQTSIEEVLTWLDKRNVSCVVLTSELIREFYQIPEAADTSPLRLYVSEGNYALARGYLIDLGYEVDQEYEGFGEHFIRAASVPIVMYHRLPFRVKEYIRSIQRLLESVCLKESYKRIRVFSIESEFIYRMASATYLYVTDELTMRDVLELQLYHSVLRDRIRMDAVQKFLKDIQIDELAGKILRLSYMWFGDKKENYYGGLPDNMGEYDVLEERLLTRGMIKHEADTQALKLEKLIQKELDKEKKEEKIQRFKRKLKERWNRFKRTWTWIFPDYHYMSSIYSILEKIPFLLPVFWVIRGVRLLERVLKN